MVVYGTLCLYWGDFAGTYATFPLLLLYYVWFVARKVRRRRQEGDGDGPSES
jgi:hypothetical protein